MLIHEQSSLMTEWNYLETELSESAQIWNDSMRRQFESEYWEPIAQVIPDYLSALRELAEAITTVDQFLRYNSR